MNKIIEENITRMIIDLYLDNDNIDSDEMMVKVAKELSKTQNFDSGKNFEKLKYDLKEIIPRLLTNEKFKIIISKIKNKNTEIKRIKKEQIELYKVGDNITAELVNSKKYLNMNDIAEIIEKNSNKKYSKNTILSWNQKGYLGDGIFERELMPNSYESHRTIYFKKEDVLDFLIRDGYLEPKYEVLDEVNGKTVINYDIDRNNNLIYYVQDISLNEAEYILE